MTPQEFKAWFEGFTEAFDRLPTKAQWARVKERVAEIDGKSVTERVFVDRYWPTYVNQYPPYRPPYWTTYCASNTSNTSGSGGGSATLGLAAMVSNNVGFNSSAAMLQLGRADAKSLAV